MNRKRTDILNIWFYLIFASVLGVTTEVTPDPTSNIVSSVSESGYSDLSDIKIEPTKALETSIKETVVIVGGGAGGVAAAVKLPDEAEHEPGVEQVVSTKPGDQTTRESAGSSPAEDTVQTDTIPEIATPPIAIVTKSAPVPSDGKLGHPHAETSSSSQSEASQQQNPQPPPSSDSIKASPGQDDQTQPLTGIDHQAQPNPGTVTNSGDHKVVQLPAKDSSPPAPVDNVDGAAAAGGSGGGGGKQEEVKAGDGVAVESVQGSSGPVQPEPKVDSPIPDLSQVMPPINPSQMGKREKPSNLPSGVGGMAVEPEFVPESGAARQSRVSGSEAGVQSDDSQQQQAANPGGEGEGDFPTFDKWSVQYLAEQEKQKIEKEQEQAQVVKPGPQKKLRQNFAAEGCGAKVVSSNAEAENVNYLLNGNPDEYMINPCKAKKWFVVELCEPVQIHKVELGTLELFSSPPKSFRVASSQRFPTKDWTQIGQFEMSPDRSVQSFHTPVGEEFVKFLRVEMLEHHGKEHYCPLTTLRVLGIDMALDDEEDSGDTDGHEPEHSDSDDVMDGAVSLFDSARETVVRLVQKVLYNGEKEESAEEADNATQIEEEKKSEEQETTTSCPIKDADQTTSTTIAPDVQVDAPYEEKPAPTEQSEEVQQPSAKDVAPSTTETPIIRKLEDTEQLPLQTETPVVVKLDPEEEDSNPKSSSKAPAHSARRTTTACPNSLLRPFFTLGWDVSIPASSSVVKPMGEIGFSMKRVVTRTRSTTVPEPNKISKKGNEGFLNVIEEKQNAHPMSQKGKQQSDSAAAVEEQNQATHDITHKGVNGQGSKDQDQSASLDTPSVDVTAATKTADEGQVTSEDGVKETDPAASHLAAAASSVLSDQAQNVAGTVSVSSALADAQKQGQPQLKEPVIEPSVAAGTGSLGGGEGSVASSVVVTPTLNLDQTSVVLQGAPGGTDAEVLQVDPSPTTNDGVNDDIMTSMSQLPSSPSNSETPSSVHDGNAESVGDDSTTSASSQSVDVTEPEPVPSQTTQARQAPKVPDLVKVGMPSAKRDASIMKLNNRIVSLEQNVSMTKKYLEELSRAFKQQNEEMMKLINKTESKINGLMARYNERDLLQQAAIAVLDQKVANLTKVIDIMQVKMDTMAEELWRGQMLLGLLQAIAFVWLFKNSASGTVTCSHGKRLQTPPASLACSGSESPILSPQRLEKQKVEGGEQIGLARRSSDGELHKQQLVKEEESMKKFERESNSLDVNYPVEESTKEILSQNSKKKKKKKQRQSQLLDSTGATSESNVGQFLSDSAHSTPAQTPSFSSSAGVLFGTAGASASPSTAQTFEPPCTDSAIAKTTAAAVTVTTMQALPSAGFGEMKENSSPVGDAGLAQAVWPGMLGSCRMCGDLLAARATQRDIHTNPWMFRFPSARLSAPGLCQTHNVMEPYGHLQYPQAVSLVVPPVPGLGQTVSGNISPSQPFLDLSNSIHQPGLPPVYPQLSPLLRVSDLPPATMASPEFKLPAYRRSKIRRVSESSETEQPSGGGGLGQSEGSHFQNRRPHPGSTARKSLIVTESRRRKSDFMNPKPWEEFFLAKNYLSENRFKFPSSPPKDNLSAEASVSGELAQSDASASSLSLVEVGQETFRAAPESSGKPDSLQPPVDRPSFASSTRFHPSTPSFIPLQQSLLNSSDNDVFQSSSSAWSSTSLRTSPQQKQQAALRYEGSKSSKDKRRNTISSSSAQPCEEQATANTSSSSASSNAHTGSSKSGGGKRPSQKTHRRQGSYPLDQIDSSKQNTSKLGQSHSGSKQSLSSGATPHPHTQSSKSDRGSTSELVGVQQAQPHHQTQGGSKFKKVLSSPALTGQIQSRKGAGAKSAGILQGSSCMVTKPRRVIGASPTISEKTVTVD